jgi:hypothetical protein
MANLGDEGNPLNLQSK